MATLRLLRELLSYFADARRRWLLPIVLVLIVMGALLVIGSSATFAPFIYTLF